MAQIAPTTKLFLKPQKPYQTLLKSIKPIAIIANCFGLLPVDGVTSNSVEDLSFRWISLKTLYSGWVLLLAFCGNVLHLTCLFKDGFSCREWLTFSAYLIWLLTIAAYFYLATKWRKLMKKWHEVDLSMNSIYNYPSSLNSSCKVTAAVAFVSSVVYVLVAFPKGDQALSGDFSTIVAIIKGHHIQIQLVNLLIQIIFVFTVFTWALNDAFIVCISTALALRFKQITDRVLLHGRNMKSLEFWSEIRTDYIRLFELCQLINKYISFQISISIASNAWFILLDLFLIIRYSNTEQNRELAFCYIDLVWCAFAIICITLYTSWVNDENNKFAAALNNIPPKNHNLAIKLLLEQMPFNPVALSGNNIFECRRELILNILGAVITYELLLIQFSDAIISR